MAGALAKADGGQHIAGAVPALFGRQALVNHRQFDIAERGRPPQQIEALEHKADMIVAEFSGLVGRQGGDILAGQEILPRAWPIERAD